MTKHYRQIVQKEIQPFDRVVMGGVNWPLYKNFPSSWLWTIKHMIEVCLFVISTEMRPGSQIYQSSGWSHDKKSKNSTENVCICVLSYPEMTALVFPLCQSLFWYWTANLWRAWKCTVYSWITVPIKGQFMSFFNTAKKQQTHWNIHSRCFRLIIMMR